MPLTVTRSVPFRRRSFLLPFPYFTPGYFRPVDTLLASKRGRGTELGPFFSYRVRSCFSSVLTGVSLSHFEWCSVVSGYKLDLSKLFDGLFVTEKKGKQCQIGIEKPQNSSILLHRQ